MFCYFLLVFARANVIWCELLKATTDYHSENCSLLKSLTII